VADHDRVDRRQVGPLAWRTGRWHPVQVKADAGYPSSMNRPPDAATCLATMKSSAGGAHECQSHVSATFRQRCRRSLAEVPRRVSATRRAVDLIHGFVVANLTMRGNHSAETLSGGRVLESKSNATSSTTSVAEPADMTPIFNRHVKEPCVKVAISASVSGVRLADVDQPPRCACP